MEFHCSEETDKLVILAPLLPLVLKRSVQKDSFVILLVSCFSVQVMLGPNFEGSITRLEIYDRALNAPGIVQVQNNQPVTGANPALPFDGFEITGLGPTLIVPSTYKIGITTGLYKQNHSFR